jgi:hypothetical protein
MRRAILAVSLLAAACSDTSGDDEPPADGGTDADTGAFDTGNADAGDGGVNPIVPRGACTDDERWGVFLVEAQDLYSLVDGKVANGVVPAAIPELVGTEGDCKLLRRRNPFCNPPCMAGQACDHDGVCIPYPMQQNVGTVPITGLEKAIVMEPLPPSNNYFDTDVPHPVFVPGAEIRLTTTGGAFDPIELFGFGFELLADDGSPWRVERGQDLALSWTPPAEVRTRIDFRLNIDQHGNSPVTLSCDLEDDGSAEIPASLIDMLFDSGVSGFPNGAITRETVDKAAAGDGCAELRISSPKRGMIEVVGHTPCTNSNQCPPGQTCDIPTNTCR